MEPVRLACRLNPPAIALVYRQNGQQYVHSVNVTVQGQVRGAKRDWRECAPKFHNLLLQTPTRLAQALKKRYPDHYRGLALHQASKSARGASPGWRYVKLRLPQLTRVLAKLFEEDEEAAPTTMPGMTSASFGDLQRAGPATMAKAKMVMDAGFNAQKVSPSDPNFQYDKRVDFTPQEDNDWDDESDDEVAAAPAPAAVSEPASAPAPAASTGYRPSWMAAGDDDAQSDGSELSLGVADELPDDDDSQGSIESDLDVDDIY